MDTSKEQLLVSELKQICKRLGEALAGIDSDLRGSIEKVDGISADLNELRLLMSNSLS